MIPITDNEGAARAKYELELALLGGSDWQLHAGESPPTWLERGSYELSVEWGKLIFAWWADGRSESWRVTGYEVGPVELKLRATRGPGRGPVELALRDPARVRSRRRPEESSAAERRARYAAGLARLIALRHPGARVRPANSGAGNSRLLPGPHARIVLEVGGAVTLAVGVNEGEAQDDIDAVITAGLIWLAGFNGRRAGGRQAHQLWLCVPRGRSEVVTERLTLIDAGHLGARAECFEVNEAEDELTAVRPATQAELLNSPPREVSWPGGATAPGRWRERVVGLAPELIEVREQAGGASESYAIHGLEFARAGGRTRARVSFGLACWPPDSEAEGHTKPGSSHAIKEPVGASHPTSLSEANFGELERLVREIIAHRRPGAAERRHPFYRLRAEAWLESLLRRDISALDAGLDGRFVYSQIPTWRADRRSMLDLLAVTKEGRLAVIEIKAAEDADLPLQGLDYWLRVEQARGRGEFERRGLFPGVKLVPLTPLLYLVAPRLRFHRSFSAIARCLAPEVEVYRIGLNANWREGVRVRARERVN